MRTTAPASLLRALLWCLLLLLLLAEPAEAAQKRHASSFSISSRLAALVPSLGSRSSGASGVARSGSSGANAAVRFVQQLIPSTEKKLAQARILPRATTHLRRLGRWAGTLWQRARVSVVSTLPDSAWLHVLTWFRQAKHRLAAVLLNLAERYDLNFEHAEDWLEDAHGETQRESGHSGGDEAAQGATCRADSEETEQADEHEAHRPAADKSSHRELETTSEAIEHIGYSHQGSPVVLVDIKGTWEADTADAFNNTLCSMFEQHEEVYVLVHVSSASALSRLPSATINSIVQGVLERHPGKRLKAFITPNPGRALAWAFSQTHRRIEGLQMTFVDPHDLGKLVEPNVLPESLRMVAA